MYRTKHLQYLHIRLHGNLLLRCRKILSPNQDWTKLKEVHRSLPYNYTCLHISYIVKIVSKSPTILPGKSLSASRWTLKALRSWHHRLCSESLQGPATSLDLGRVRIAAFPWAPSLPWNMKQLTSLHHWIFACILCFFHFWPFTKPPMILLCTCLNNRIILHGSVCSFHLLSHPL